jgi:hypothetical protein
VSRRIGAASCLALLLALPVTTAAQVRMSERGSVGQTVDGTTISVDYARPQARGRSPIFGKVVHWGDTWTPGANLATTITVSKDVKVNGRGLPKGTYSVWMVTAQSEEWVVFFHPTARLFHTQRPKADSAALRVMVKPETVEPTDILTFNFTALGRDRTTLRMNWETTSIPLVIEVPSSRPALPAIIAGAYTGAWSVIMTGEDGKVDTLAFTIEVKDGRLQGEVPTWGWSFELVPTRSPHTFQIGNLEKGEVVDIEVDYPFVFMMEGDRAVRFLVRSDTNDEWMRGVRAK